LRRIPKRRDRDLIVAYAERKGELVLQNLKMQHPEFWGIPAVHLTPAERATRLGVSTSDLVRLEVQLIRDLAPNYPLPYQAMLPTIPGIDSRAAQEELTRRAPEIDRLRAEWRKRHPST